ncbi:MAG: hypothetical protein EXS16_12295 [Gemmataceae bacterium]|nr:hypothetical protein [Gemmataceae bacterium]
MPTILCLSALLCLTQIPPDFRDRDRHPLAPSLPLLTKDESKKIDTVIERFIQYDIGVLKGAEGKKALDDFNNLGPEATFNLVHGLNRTANIQSSCPAVIIAKKLASIYLMTEDLQLLGYSKDLIGIGVTGKRHLGVIRDLQTNILLRKGYLQRKALVGGGTKSYAELESAINKGTIAQKKAALTEAEKRQGPKAIGVLLMGIASLDAELSQWSRGLLDKNLQRESADSLKLLMKDKRKDARLAAVSAVSAKKLRLGSELIDLLLDPEIEVREASRQAIVRMANGRDFGPESSANVGEREAAVMRWRAWWKTGK